MNADEVVRLPDVRHEARLSIREVIRDLDGTPHTWLRVELRGYSCPPRAQDYHIVIGNQVSRFTRHSADGLSLRAYFDRPLPRAKVVTLTYGRLALADFPLDVDMRYVPRLDRARLPPGTVDRTL